MQLPIRFICRKHPNQCCQKYMRYLLAPNHSKPSGRRTARSCTASTPSRTVALAKTVFQCYLVPFLVVKEQSFWTPELLDRRPIEKNLRTQFCSSLNRSNGSRSCPRGGCPGREDALWSNSGYPTRSHHSKVITAKQ